MRFTTIGKRWSLVALVACSLLTCDALAQRGERGEQGGGGGRGGGGGAAFRSGGGGEGRSLRGGGGGERSFSRSMPGGAERSSRSGAPSAQSFRSYDGGRSATRPSDLGPRPSFSREAFREGRQFDGRQTIGPRDDRSLRTARSPGETGQRRYQAARPTDDQVRDFLQLPQDRKDMRPSQPGDRGVDRNFRRSDQAFQRDFQPGERRDLTGRLRDEVTGRVERDVSERDRRGQDFRDDDFDRNYQRWREGAWTGIDRRGRDDRDWSGRWREGRRFDVARDIRQLWRDRDWDDDDFPFRLGWWGGRNWHGRRWDHWDYWARSRPFYWWYWTTAPRLSNWIVYRWGTPYYWDYGPGEYIYYDDGAIYVNGRWYQLAPVFYDNTVRLLEQAPDLTAEDAARVEWLPLGVFAVTPDGRAEAEVLVQLAVTQEGVIGGTAFDQQNGVNYAVEGVVEKQSQRAVWSYTDNRGRRIVMETSIFNLTQPEATGLIHYSPEDIRVVELVRLEPPEGGSVAASATVAPEGELPPPATR